MVDCFKAHVLLSSAVSRCLQSARNCWCCFPSALNLPSIGFCSMRSKNLASVCEKETLIPPSTPIKVCSTPLSARSSSIRHHLSFKNTRLGGSKRRIGVGDSEASEKGAASARELAHCSIDDPESDFVSRQSTEASVCKGSPSSELDAWCCYLLLSADSSKTYVGVTCNMQRRLKQHNGELSGGAKAARAGRPWHLVCTVHGFGTRSEVCQFEWHWKHTTRSLKAKVSASDSIDGAHLLQRRQHALEKVQNKDAAWKRLEVHWHL